MGFGHLPRPLTEEELEVLRHCVEVRGRVTTVQARHELSIRGSVLEIGGYFNQQLIRSGIALQNNSGRASEAFFTEFGFPRRNS